MRSYNDWLDPGGGRLSNRLDQLRDSLESLNRRLRITVAEAIGETLGGLVHDAVFRVLDQLTRSDADADPTRRTSPGWDPSRTYYEEDELQQTAHWREYDPEGEESERQLEDAAPQVSSRRLALTLSAGLQAAAWWLRSCINRRSVMTTIAVGLLAGCVAVAAPTLATAALSVAGSIGQLGLLNGVLQPNSLIRSAFGRT
jgi:hypothetical protein